MPTPSRFEELKARVEACRKCSLWKHRTNVVVGFGNLSADVMLVGEAPGKREDETGMPFVGRAGKFLDELLGYAGLKREEVYISNVVKCRPPGNRDPLEEEIRACSPYLDWEFSKVNPKLVIPLGRFALSFFQEKFGLKPLSITKVHGEPIPIESLFFSFTLFPSYHPAAGLYRGEIKEQLISDWKKLREVLRSLIK